MKTVKEKAHLCGKVLAVGDDGDGGACGRDGGLRLGKLLVQVGQLRDGIRAVLVIRE